MGRIFSAAAVGLVAAAFIVAAPCIRPGYALDIGQSAGTRSQSLQTLFDSEFAILRIEGKRAHVAASDLSFVKHRCNS